MLSCVSRRDILLGLVVQKNNGVGDNTKAQIVASDKRGPQTGVESIKKSFSRVPWSLNMRDPPQVHCILTISASDFFSIFPFSFKRKAFSTFFWVQPFQRWRCQFLNPGISWGCHWFHQFGRSTAGRTPTRWRIEGVGVFGHETKGLVTTVRSGLDDGDGWLYRMV